MRIKCPWCNQNAEGVEVCAPLPFMDFSLLFQHPKPLEKEDKLLWIIPWDSRYYYCARCAKKYNEIVDRWRRSDPSTIKSYSANYKGRITGRILGRVKSARWYKDRNDALESIKRQASFLGGRIVKDVSYEYDTEEDGNYIYKVWSAEGTVLE